MAEDLRLFTEDAVAYTLYRHCLALGSKIFFKFQHNFKIVGCDRKWYYYCAPDVDLIEVRADGCLIAYELKGARKYKEDQQNWPAMYDGIGQAVAYLNLPRVCDHESARSLFEGGVFDRVYVVCGRETAAIDPGERRILSVVPIGAMLALPDGRLETVKEAPQNPIQNSQAKLHFLRNLDSLDKHGDAGKTFRRIRKRGEEYFSRGGSS